MTLSPLAPSNFPDLPKISGINLATAASGTRYKGRDDLLLITLVPNSSVAGVFTKSDTAAILAAAVEPTAVAATSVLSTRGSFRRTAVAAASSVVSSSFAVGSSATSHASALAAPSAASVATCAPTIAAATTIATTAL